MAETNGAKIIPGPGVRTSNAVRDEAILQDLARGVKAAELAEKHGVSIQRIYNLKSENRDRVAELQVAEIEVMPILKHETFADLWIMKPAARMAGFSEIGQVALRKFLELNAASYVYNPESGQPVATRLNRHDVAAMKVFADMYSKAVRDAVELSGEMPARLGERFVLRTIKKHQDPPPPKSEEELAAEEAEQERATAEREARVAARMRQQYPFLFPLSEAENARRNELFDAQYEAEAASLRANGMALTEEEKAERLAYLEGLGDDLLDGRDLARLEYLQGRFDADDGEYNALQGELDSALEPVPEPSVTAPVREETVPEPSVFVASVAAAMRGCAKDDQLFLDVIDACVYFGAHGDELADDLRSLLLAGGSVWTVAADCRSLQLAVDPQARAALERATSEADTSSAELSEAWRKAYRRNPDPADA